MTDPLSQLSAPLLVDSSLDYSAGPVQAPAIQNASLENPRLSLDDPATWDDVLGGTQTTAGIRITAATAIKQPAIWRAITLLTGDIAKLPLTLFEREEQNNGKTPARDHYAYRLTRRKANPLMTAFQFRRTLSYHALIHGNGTALIVRDGAGRPLELLILDPYETCFLIDRGEGWYLTKIANEDVAFPASDVLHIMGLSHDGLWGHNLAQVMAEAFGLGAAAREFGSRFFGDGQLSGGVLMIPGHFSEDKAKNTLRAWEKMQVGLKKSHSVALLQDGAKFEKLTIPPETAQFLETRQFETREVANVFGIPAHKLGDDSRTSHNSLEQENASYIDDSLDPWLVQWETQCDLKLLTEAEQEAESHFHEFNRNARLRTDAATRSQVYSTLFGTAALSPNDILRKENMETIGEAGERRFISTNLQPLDQPLDQAGQTEPAADPPATGATGNSLASDPIKARAKLRAAIEDRLERLKRIEAKKMDWPEDRLPGPKPPGYESKARKFYSTFMSQMKEAILPIADAAWTILAPDRAEESEDCVDETLATYQHCRINGYAPPQDLADHFLPRA